MPRDFDADLDAFSRASVLAEHLRVRAEDLTTRAGSAQNPDEAARLRGQALDADSAAVQLEEQAGKYLNAWQASRANEELAPQEKTEAELTTEAKDRYRRAWFLPGSVADDVMLQIEEAGMDGLLEQTFKYAARSVYDALNEGAHPLSIAAWLALAASERTPEEAEAVNPESVFDDRAAEQTIGTTADPPAPVQRHSEAPATDLPKGTIFEWMGRDDADLSRPSLFEARDLGEGQQQKKPSPKRDQEPEV